MMSAWSSGQFRLIDDHALARPIIAREDLEDSKLARREIWNFSLFLEKVVCAPDLRDGSYAEEIGRDPSLGFLCHFFFFLTFD